MMAKMVLDEVRPEDLVEGQDYLLFREGPGVRAEWVFGILKLCRAGWATDDELISDKPLGWPTRIFESPDAKHIVE
jgi:hypothetical protein